MTASNSATQEKIEKFLKDKNNQKFHYNDLEELDYKIPSGSLTLDLELDGGLPAGVHRFTGPIEGGKTSCSLAVAKNFQDHFGKAGMVVYVRSEGRLDPRMIERCGINTNPDRFFKLDCNIFEKVFEFIRMLVTENDEKRKYLFIIDSVDALCRQNDFDKPFEDSEQVAGGALVTSVFLKKMVLPIVKMNHMMILMSQVRVEVSANPYASRGGPKVKQAGGNAIKHYANYILEFQERYNTDIMFTNPSASRLDEKGKPIGHYCKIVFRKSVNEKTGSMVKYPIIYGRTGGNSVWVEREVSDMMRAWGFLEQKGPWISVDPELLEDLKKKKFECPDKFQGEAKLMKFLEDNPKLMTYLFTYVKKTVFNED
jgi:RecA/RadA recombinase